MFVNLRTGDDPTVGNACRNDVRFVDASPDDLAALREAVEPVYASLRADAATDKAIDAIDALRTDGEYGLACPADTALARARGRGHRDRRHLDGLSDRGGDHRRGRSPRGDGHQRRLHHDALRSRHIPRGRDGRRRARAGTYSLTDDHQLVIYRANGELFEFTWSLFQDRLSLGMPANPKAVAPAPIRAVPWVREGT